MYSAFGFVGADEGVKGLSSGRQTSPPITFGAPFASEGSVHRRTRLKAPEERGSESRW